MGAGPEFDGHPFVAGKIRGLRSFRIPPEGNRLTGCTFPLDWNPNVNHAKHVGPLVGGGVVAWARDRERLLQHEIAGSGCSCGYYGFTDGGDDYDYYASSVSGIIEGYGTVTIGSRGFRASKAKIVALIDNKARPLPPLELSRWERFALKAMTVKRWPLMTAYVSSLVIAALGTYVFAPLLAIGAVLWVGVVGVVLAGDHGEKVTRKVIDHTISQASLSRRQRSPYLDKLLEHENWKNIPVFRSKEEAMKAFPLGMVGPDA